MNEAKHFTKVSDQHFAEVEWYIRQEEKPKEPYGIPGGGKVIQCMGKNNCNMNTNVNAFVKVFEKKMQSLYEKEAPEKTIKVG